MQQLAAPRIGSWIVVTEPDEAELDKLASDYGLERDNLTDAVDLYEAPRIEVEGGMVYIYTRYCHPEGREIATEPLLIVYAPDYVFTIVRSSTTILEKLTSDQIDVVTTQKTKTLMQILTMVNYSYERQVNRLARQILQLRGQMRQNRLSTREFLSIIELEEDLNEYLSALQPQALVLSSLVSGKYLRLYEEDRDIIEDLERGTSELIDQLRGRLRTLGNMREAYDAIATTNLNSIFKKLTSISIFIAIPNLIISFWSMNVPIPFQRFHYIFYILIAFAVGVIVSAFLIFRRNRWL